MFSQSARKHRIGKGRALYVISTTDATEDYNPDKGAVEFEWLGPDQRGLELHIIGLVKTDDRGDGTTQIILITHVFPTPLKKGRNHD